MCLEKFGMIYAEMLIVERLFVHVCFLYLKFYFRFSVLLLQENTIAWNSLLLAFAL